MRNSVRQGRGNAIIKHLPHFYQSGDDENLLHGFVEMFGRVLDVAEEDLLRVMRAHWVNTADNSGSKGFDSDLKGDLDKIFALFLENLGGTAQLRQIGRREGEEGLEDDAAYRTRIKALIEVLLRGASTREGIRSVVGANLGIFGEEMNTTEMRQKIQVIEYLAGEGASTQSEFTPPVDLPVFGEFTVNNSQNPVASAVRLILTVHDPSNFLSTQSLQLLNLCVWDARTNQIWASFKGPLVKNDRLEFMPDGSILLNGIMAQKSDRFAPMPEGLMVKFVVMADFQTINAETVPRLLQGGRYTPSIEAQANRTEPKFGGMFKGDAFNQGTMFSPTVNLFQERHSLLLLQPATFQVRIYWDIPPYTAVLDQRPDDNTRGLIRHIVDRVKAAGVYSEVNFVKNLSETHEVQDNLHIKIGHIENQDNREGNVTIGDFKKLYGNGLPHEMDERFSVSGIFDYTSFGSLNGFA